MGIPRGWRNPPIVPPLEGEGAGPDSPSGTTRFESAARPRARLQSENYPTRIRQEKLLAESLEAPGPYIKYWRRELNPSAVFVSYRAGCVVHTLSGAMVS